MWQSRGARCAPVKEQAEKSAAGSGADTPHFPTPPPPLATHKLTLPLDGVVQVLEVSVHVRPVRDVKRHLGAVRGAPHSRAHLVRGEGVQTENTGKRSHTQGRGARSIHQSRKKREVLSPPLPPRAHPPRPAFPGQRAPLPPMQRGLPHIPRAHVCTCAHTWVGGYGGWVVKTLRRLSHPPPLWRVRGRRQPTAGYASSCL